MRNELYRVFASYVSRQIRRLSRHLGGVRKGDDPEAIHQARVACRRLRASLRHLREVLPRHLTRGRKLRKLRQNLRRFARALGEARDLDVQAGRLENLASGELSPEAKPGMEWIIRRLQDLRREVQKEVSDAVDWLRGSTVLSRLKSWTDLLGEAQASETEIKEVVARGMEVLRQEVYRARKGAKEALAQSNPESLHAFRITIKRLRYTLELWEEVNSELFARPIEQFRQWQELLGAICDGTVGEALLKRLQSGQGRGRGGRSPRHTADEKLAPGFRHFLLFCQTGKEAAEEKLREALRAAEKKKFWMELSESLDVGTLFREVGE